MNTRTTNGRKGHFKEKAIEEFRLYLVVFAFLALIFGGFMTYRRLVMNEVGMSYAHWGAGIVSAAIIAKVILIGQALSLGKRTESRPLIVSVTVKALLYGLLVGLFSVLERVIDGLFHGDTWAAIAHQVVIKGPDEMLANTVMVFIAFIPFFALWETGRELGPGKLAEMFFHARHA